MSNDDLFPFLERAPRPVISIKPKARLPEATRASLRAAIAQAPGEALRLLLAVIDEDPRQPRTVFDEAELQSMAESIRAHGVVQPIVVRPPVNGRYVLAFGARRLRASRLAQMPDIPAVIRAAGEASFAEQLVENQQRANLSNRELAAAIAKLAREGATNKQIAALCALKDYQVAAFRQAGNFPPEFTARMDTADIRALYDLYRQWGKTPREVIAALPELGVFISVTEARRIIAAITGKPSGSIVLDRASAAELEKHSARLAGTELGDEREAHLQKEPKAAPQEQAPFQKLRPPLKEAAAQEGLPVQRPTRPSAASRPGLTASSPSDAPVFIVSAGNERAGRLVVDRRAAGVGLVLVAYPTGIEEVPAMQLRFVRVE